MSISIKLTYRFIYFIAALWLSTTYWITFGLLMFESKIPLSTILANIHPLNSEFYLIFLFISIVLSVFYFIFTYRKGNQIRRILVPALIIGFLSSISQFLTFSWGGPNVSWLLGILLFVKGAGLYLIFLGTYNFILRILKKKNKMNTANIN